MSSGYQAHETRRNYGLLVAEGILFTVGLVFFDPNTVLPLLMERLTGSAVLVGVLAAVQPLAKGFAPIISGNWISSLRYKKRFLLTAMAVGRAPLWILALSLIWIPRAPAYLWAVLLLSVQVLFWFGDASGDPAWMDMVGKSVRYDRRGRFFATRQVVGGLLSVVAGIVVAAVLGRETLSFPVNYGVVVLIGAAIYLANVGTFTGLIERPSSTSERLPLGALFRGLPRYLGANRPFALTMGVLVLFNMARLSIPFYIVFGRQVFGLPDSAIGFIIPVQMAGRVTRAHTVRSPLLCARLLARGWSALHQLYARRRSRTRAATVRGVDGRWLRTRSRRARSWRPHDRVLELRRPLCGHRGALRAGALCGVQVACRGINPLSWSSSRRSAPAIWSSAPSALAMNRLTPYPAVHDPEDLDPHWYVRWADWAVCGRLSLARARVWAHRLAGGVLFP